jgi:hypothetical protein
VQSAGFNKTAIKGVESVRDGLRGHAPLTFQQLCWPTAAEVNGGDQALYDSCAELFFESLMNFNDGRECLRQMLAESPSHLNWQTSFLQAFHAHFLNLLDVEKWWGLTCVSFTEADLTESWTAQECWRKLQDALDVPVDVRFGPSRMPAPACLTLQEAIEQWDTPQALSAVNRAVRELEELRVFALRCDLNLGAAAASPDLQRNAAQVKALQWRMNRQLTPMIDSYLKVLLAYAKQCQSAPRYAASGLLFANRETARELTELDKQRAALRAAQLSAVDYRGGNSGSAHD